MRVDTSELSATIKKLSEFEQELERHADKPAVRERLHKALLDFEGKVFSSRGGELGGWPARVTLVKTGRLKRSLTQRGGENVWSVRSGRGRARVTFGSAVPYASAHPATGLTSEIVDRLLSILTQHLIEG